MNRIRLLIIEDNRLLRDGILAILKPHKEFLVVAAPGENKNSLAKLQQLNPDVILLDLGLRNQNNLHVVEILKTEFPKTKIVVMDLAPVQADIFQYVKAGAKGFILKDASLHEFLVTLRTVARGDEVLPPLLVNSLFAQIVDHALREGKLKLKEAVRMTKREREVIGFLGDGMSNKEISQKIHVTTYTVKSHIHNIMEKLALHTRLELANYSFNHETIRTISKTISTLNS